MKPTARLAMRQFTEAVGYLELGLAQHALDRLEGIERIPSAMRPEAELVRGMVLRDLGRCREAIPHLQYAAERDPSNVRIWLALGWCHKRTQRLDLAIEALESARRECPAEPTVIYNLACYWSLQRNKDLALQYLGRALELDARFRTMIAAESDFDPIRSDPDFQAIAGLPV